MAAALGVPKRVVYDESLRLSRSRDAARLQDRDAIARMAVPRFLHPYARPAREHFITIVRGEGALVYDADGQEYVDGMASLWYMNVGYGREEIVTAAADQMRRLVAYNTFDPFTNEPAEAARRPGWPSWPRSTTPACSSPATARRRSTRPSSWPASPRCRPATPSAR